MLLALAANLARGDGMVRGLVGAVSLGLPVGALAVLLYSPFYATFHPLAQGLHPLEAARREYGPLEGAVTFPNHFVITWLPMLWLLASLTAAALARARHIVLPLRAAAWALVPAALPLAWAGAVLYRRGLGGFGEELGERGASLLTAFIVAALATAAVLALLKQTRLGASGQANPSALFALVLGMAAVLLILGPEFFWVRESPPRRWTTLWKASYQAWILLSVAGVFALHYVTASWTPRLSRRTLGFALWGGVTFVLLAASMLYPLMGTFYISASFGAGRHLDGLRYTQLGSPLEYQAIRWLADNVEGTPVVLETVGEEFSLDAPARVSTRTGLPTVLGWAEHEYRWRGSWEPQLGRRDDVARIYKTLDAQEARVLLAKYDVEYVFVGGMERLYYGDEGMVKFASFMDVAFGNGEVTIYRTRAEASPLPLVPGATAYVWQWRQKLVIRWPAVISVMGEPQLGQGWPCPTVSY
jgi:uncharacterized membrane protein